MLQKYYMLCFARARASIVIGLASMVTCFSAYGSSSENLDNLFKALYQRRVDNAKRFLNSGDFLADDCEHIDENTGDTLLTLSLKKMKAGSGVKFIGDLLEKCNDINLKNRMGEHPLMVAAKNGAPQTIEMLAKRAHFSEYESKFSTTFIQTVINRVDRNRSQKSNKFNFEDFLLMLGDRQGLDFRTVKPLKYSNGTKSAKDLVAYVLLAKPTDGLLQHIRSEGYVSASYACELVEKNHLELFKTIAIDNSEQFKTIRCKQKKNTLLMEAISAKHSAFVDYLLDYELSPVNITNNDLKSALSIAYMTRNFNAVKKLISMGANPSELVKHKNGDGFVPVISRCILEQDHRMLDLLKVSKCLEPKLRGDIQRQQNDMRALVERSGNKPAEKHKDDPSNIELLEQIESMEDSFSSVYAGAVPSGIEDLMKFLKLPEETVKEFCPDHKQTVLFYGPTGTGKTTLAHAIAVDSGFRFFKLVPSRVASKFIGESEKNLGKIFERLSRFVNETDEKIVLFIDEIDSLLTSRGGKQSNVSDFNSKVAAVFLEYFGEGSHAEKKKFLRNIVLIGATNSKEEIPANVLGRFSYKVKMPNPSAEVRLEILKFHLGKLDSSRVKMSEEDLERVAFDLMEGFSARQITHIVSKAALKALIRFADQQNNQSEAYEDYDKVTINDIEAVLEEEAKHTPHDPRDNESYKHIYT